MELAFWEVPACLLGMAQANHCLSKCEAPAYIHFGFLLLLDILTLHCAVFQVHDPHRSWQNHLHPWIWRLLRHRNMHRMFLKSSRCSHLPSSKIDTDLHLQLSVNNLYQSAPNIASCQHRCLPPGAPHSHLGGEDPTKI